MMKLDCTGRSAARCPKPGGAGHPGWLLGNQVPMLSVSEKRQTACRAPGRFTRLSLLSQPSPHRHIHAKMLDHKRYPPDTIIYEKNPVVKAFGSRNEGFREFFTSGRMVTTMAGEAKSPTTTTALRCRRAGRNQRTAELELATVPTHPPI